MTGGAGTVTYQWRSNDLPILGATSATFKVNADYIGQVLSVIVTDAEGNTAESADTAPVTSDMSAEIVLKDVNGLQEDGTALPTDLLQVSYGSDLGTPSVVIWYCNGAAKDVDSLDGAGITNASFTSAGSVNIVTGVLDAGEWWVTIENTAGVTSVSNVITVSDNNRAVMSDASLENNYDDPQIDYTADTDDMILNVTFNKKYLGKLYLAPADTKNFNTTKLDNVIDLSTTTKWNAAMKDVKKASGLTNKAAKSEGAGKGIYYADSTGTVHAKFAADLTSGKNVTRGTDYMLIFDQDDVVGDELPTTGSADKDDLNISDTFEAPYLAAPASIAITSFDKSAPTTAQITFYGEDGEELAWWSETNAFALTGSMAKAEMYPVDSNKIDSGDTAKSVTALKIKDGVGTVTTSGLSKTYAYAKVKTNAGIFAESAVELVSEVVESAPEAADKVELKEASTPENATVNFTGLHKAADGVVYILQGTSTASTAAQIAAISTDDAVASAEVSGGSTTVEIANVFKGKQIGAADNADKFVAVFVPNDTTVYSKKASGLFTLESVPTSLEFGTATTNITTDAGGATGDVEIAPGAGVTVLNQFGSAITAGKPGKAVTDKAVSALTVKNAGGLTGEQFGNAIYSITEAGALSMKVERNSLVDNGDGFEATILGSKFTVTAPFGVGQNNKTNSALWTVKVGNDAIETAAVPTAITVSGEQGLVAALAAAAGDTSHNTVVTIDGVSGGGTITLSKNVTIAKGDSLATTATDGLLNAGTATINVYGTITSGAADSVTTGASGKINMYSGSTFDSSAATYTGAGAVMTIAGVATDDPATITFKNDDTVYTATVVTTGATTPGTLAASTTGTVNVLNGDIISTGNTKTFNLAGTRS